MSGMLTAVLDFIHQAFRGGATDAGAQRIDFGDRSIFLKRGEHLFFALVVKGRETPRLRNFLESTVKLIEERWGDAVEHWDGSATAMEEVREFVHKRVAATGKLKIPTIPIGR